MNNTFNAVFWCLIFVYFFITALTYAQGTAPRALDYSKTIFIGDSLTKSLGDEYKKLHKNTDIIYYEGEGIISNRSKIVETIKNTDFKKYEYVYLSVGTNDMIRLSTGTSNSDNYSDKVLSLIETIRKSNPIIKIYWIIPPKLRDTRKEEMLIITRLKIYEVCEEYDINIIDPLWAFGVNYTEFVDGRRVRTQDGIHYTSFGAKMVILIGETL